MVRKGERGRFAASIVWALSPLWSLGFLTAPAMAFAAIRKRSWLQGLGSLPYVAGMVLMFTNSDAPDGSTGKAVFSAALAVNFLLATAHTFGIRRWVFERTSTPVRTDHSLLDRQAAALALDHDETKARAAARAVIARDPREALRLQIGRVDIPDRRYPDGGLIDLNHVPADALAAALEIPERTARHIVEVREGCGGFGSVAEVSVLADLPPHLFDASADRVVVVPSASSDPSAAS